MKDPSRSVLVEFAERTTPALSTALTTMWVNAVCPGSVGRPEPVNDNGTLYGIN